MARHAPPPPDAHAMDDYYSRPHITPSDASARKPVLFVGGSDGSGTRAFVATLMKLDVPMLVDDTVGYDVHALTLYKGEGWPPLVNAILNAMGTANYEVDNLPIDVKRATTAEVMTFREQIERRGAAKVQAFRDSGNLTTTKVRYGLKAPVSMLLLPMLQQAFGPIKFIHVVRDGRDVACSKNQSPVKKFYDSFYKDSEAKRQLYDNDFFKPVMAMELWNDWNVQVHDWAHKHNDAKSFDYLVMRSEDLLESQTRYQSLLQLAHFVGSPKTPQEICCMSRESLTDLGVSGKHGPDPSVSNSSSPADSKIEEEHRADWEYAFKPMDQALERRTKELAKLQAVAPHLYEQINKMQQAQEKEMQNRRKERMLHKFGTRLRVEDILLRQNDRQDAAGSHRRLGEALPSPSDEPPTEPQEVGKRYGKWMTEVQGNMELNKLLHRMGQAGLAQFGYEPQAPFLDINKASFKCDQTVVCSTA